MGRKFDDAEVQKALKHVPYKVKAAANGDVRVVDGRQGVLAARGLAP